MIQTFNAFTTVSGAVGAAATPITAAAFGITEAQMLISNFAYITPMTGDVILTWSGTAPTSTKGHYLMQNASIEIMGNTNIRNLQFIRVGGADVTVSITLEG